MPLGSFNMLIFNSTSEPYNSTTELLNNSYFETGLNAMFRSASTSRIGDYISYVTTPLFFIVGIIGKNCRYASIHVHIGR